MYSPEQAKREYEEANSAGIDVFELTIFQIAIRQAKEATGKVGLEARKERD